MFQIYQKLQVYFRITWRNAMCSAMKEILRDLQCNSFHKTYDPAESHSVILTANLLFLEKPKSRAIWDF